MRVVYFKSKKLIITQSRYDATKRKLFCTLIASERFIKLLLLSERVTYMYNDQKLLISLISAKDSFPLIRLWVTRISRFKCVVKYMPGKRLLVDFLSRISGNYTEWEIPRGLLDEERSSIRGEK